MSTNLTVTVEGPVPHLTGFRYWWLKHVVGYDLSVHCARCLRGKYDRRINRQMATGEPIELASPLVYLCGVSPRWVTNFHAAAEHAPGRRFEVDTYNGFTVRFANARRIDIEPLPEGYDGLPREFTTCRNFQFAVQMCRDIAVSTSS